MVKVEILSLLSESKMKLEKERDSAMHCFECPATGSTTQAQLRLTQVQDRPAETISKLNNKSSMNRGAVISRHLFLHYKHFRRASHYLHMYAFLYKKGGKKT